MVRAVLVRILSLGFTLTLTSCSGGGAASPTDFALRGTVYVADDIDQILVDGLITSTVDEGEGRALHIERVYQDYLVAQASPSITIELWSNATLQHSGVLAAGLCAMQCVSCPQGRDLIAEEVLLPSNADFDAYEFVCVNCVGAEFSVPVCQ
jgi:hypothetical protein